MSWERLGKLFSPAGKRVPGPNPQKLFSPAGKQFWDRIRRSFFFFFFTGWKTSSGTESAEVILTGWKTISGQNPQKLFSPAGNDFEDTHQKLLIKLVN